MEYSRGTELKINSFSNYNVSFGAMNKNKPKSLYIKISAWGNPKSKGDENYRRVIRKINKRLKAHLYNGTNKNKFNINKTMVDLDMRESGVAYGKSSFMSCEITLFQYNHHLLRSNIILTELNNISNNIIRDVFIKDEHFKFYKKKTDAKIKLKKLNRKD
jgi:hypothetical protein